MAKIILEATVQERDSAGRLDRHFRGEFQTSEFQFVIAAHDQACADNHSNVRMYLLDDNGISMPLRSQIDWARIQRHMTQTADANPANSTGHVIAGPFSGPKG